MKFNWKALVAVAVIVAAIIWAATTVPGRSYEGTELDFSVGGGLIKVTNPSDSPVPVSLASSSPGTFSVFSDTEGIAGRSSSQGSGRSANQLYEFEVPPGESEFTILRGADISFVSNSETPLSIDIQPLNPTDTRNRLLTAGLIVAVALFYLSYANGHRWISAARRQKARDKETAREEESQNFQRMFSGMKSKGNEEPPETP
jgi:hypothetical protein